MYRPSTDTGELQGPALIRIALLTLGTFDFGQCNLLEFVRDHVMTYLDDGDVSIRKSAAAAAAQVLQRHVARQTQLQERAYARGPFMPITSVTYNIVSTTPLVRVQMCGMLRFVSQYRY